MISLFRYLFKPKTLTIGSVWVHEDCYGNPFEYRVKYKVLAVKDGYVKYEVIGRLGVMSEDSGKVRDFYAFRREINEMEKVK